ncbi:MAG: response regulator [Anaerolineae bacterium]|nr:response regulator [Anaerolineae bacterium]
MAKILVIDDELILRTEIMEWLTYEDHEVRGAENGVVGIDHASEWRPDVIICDITMPHLDGFGVLLEVHSNPAMTHTPFIFVTARSTHEDIRHGMNLGADDYITKPFTRMQMLEAVQTQLGKHASREQIYQQELVQLQNTLAQEQQQRLLKARLIAMFSHDFRNPLAVILSSKSLLADYADKMNAERRLAHYNRIETSVKQLIQMLDDMLIVSQMESGNLGLKPEHLDVGKFIQLMIEEFQATNGGTHHFIFENHVETSSVADTRLLRQVGSNLISNAVKYSPHGSSIHVTLNVGEGNYVLVIQDQGIGISEEDQKQLFEAFKRGKNVGEVSGTGLGLAIVKRAVELYGGSIRVESALNQGTSMIVTLPVYPNFASSDS